MPALKLHIPILVPQKQFQWSWSACGPCKSSSDTGSGSVLGPSTGLRTRAPILTNENVASFGVQSSA